MSAVQLDSQKIEQLLNSATNERQRKMYKSLLDKARKKEQAAVLALAAPPVTLLPSQLSNWFSTGDRYS